MYVCMYVLYIYTHTIYMEIYMCTFKKVHLASTAGPGDNPAKFSKKKLSALVYLLRKVTI
jgi:hypothetical protein